jgi:hypothetical protein
MEPCNNDLAVVGRDSMASAGTYVHDHQDLTENVDNAGPHAEFVQAKTDLHHIERGEKQA